MNRLAVHQSLVHPLTPLEMIDELVACGWDSMGLHVGAVPETEAWWSGGSGTQLLAATIDRLLEARATVLDVGRVELSGSLGRDDVHRGHGRVLDFGARLGAQFLTARFADGVADLAQRTESFAELAEQARPFRIRPLLSSVPADRPDLLADAVAVVAPSGGGVVLDVPVLGVDAETVSAAVTDLWEHLGYVRVDARALEGAGEAAAGQLAVVPPQVPVVIGGDGGLGLLDSDRRARLTRLRLLVDRMLEHPRARAARERTSG
ncbi:hypothetical protein [Blastococcus atacamensis]|uniref:hypothetical protein n=1 Tax=Blastococcus atacamensis TaxID=2070508 RepID=UPI000CEBED3F|nr:hypothetical protein [Blastococcus atacamensis]